MNSQQLSPTEALDQTPTATATADTPCVADTTDTKSWTVLCVDDEPHILSALRRVLRSFDCRFLHAGSGAEALEIMAREHVAVVVSDMRMPHMDGAELLARIRMQWPQTVRILLTGYADMSATVAAINEGQIYRYITKPWDDTELKVTVKQAAERHLLEQERQRLQALTEAQNAALQTLNATLEQQVQARTAQLSEANTRLQRSYLTSIKIFSGLMELRLGARAGSGKRVANLARQVARSMELPVNTVQDIFVAGLLHDVGFMALPDSIIARPVSRLSPEEVLMYKRHPVLGEQSLMALDDHHNVAALIRWHHERFDGSGYPDQLAGSAIPLGARILAVVSTFNDLIDGHLSLKPLTETEAKTLLQRGRGTQFDPEVLDVFLHLTHVAPVKPPSTVSVPVEQLQPGMVLGKDFRTLEGVLLLHSGQSLSTSLIQRFRHYSEEESTALSLEIRIAPQAD